MNGKNAIIKVAVAVLIFMGFIFGTEVFLDHIAGRLLPVRNHNLIWLFLGIYVLAYYLGECAFLCKKISLVLARGIFLGRRWIVRWLSLVLFLCIFIRFDFSSTGLSKSLILFLLPSEIVCKVFIPSGLVKSIFLFSVVLGTFLVITGMYVYWQGVKVEEVDE